MAHLKTLPAQGVHVSLVFEVSFSPTSAARLAGLARARLREGLEDDGAAAFHKLPEQKRNEVVEVPLLDSDRVPLGHPSLSDRCRHRPRIWDWHNVLFAPQPHLLRRPARPCSPAGIGETTTAPSAQDPPARRHARRCSRRRRRRRQSRSARRRRRPPPPSPSRRRTRRHRSCRRSHARVGRDARLTISEAHGRRVAARVVPEGLVSP